MKSIQSTPTSAQSAALAQAFARRRPSAFPLKTALSFINQKNAKRLPTYWWEPLFTLYGSDLSALRSVGRGSGMKRRSPSPALRWWKAAPCCVARLVYLSELVVGAEHVDNLVLVHLLHLVASGAAELAGVKLTGFVVQHTAHGGGEGQT